MNVIFIGGLKIIRIVLVVITKFLNVHLIVKIIISVKIYFLCAKNVRRRRKNGI